MPVVGFVNETSLGGFLAELESADNPHGTVSAGAFAAAMGTSLLVKAAGLPKTRSDSAEDRRVLAESVAALRDVQMQLLETIETETAVKVFAARRLPEGSQTERKERAAALQVALRAAADVPLEVMRLGVAALTLAQSVAAHGCQAASGNVQLAVALLRAGFEAARANLESKLSSLTDASYTTSVIDEIPRLTEEAATKARKAEELMGRPAA